jgi:predicted nucleotidyltransferase component of viral defense system
MVEKVLHLMNLLNTLNTHPFLKGKWSLKGGTALNIFLSEFPRLSVDIDIRTAPNSNNHSKRFFPGKDLSLRGFPLNTQEANSG